MDNGTVWSGPLDLGLAELLQEISANEEGVAEAVQHQHLHLNGQFGCHAQVEHDFSSNRDGGLTNTFHFRAGIRCQFRCELHFRDGGEGDPGGPAPVSMCPLMVCMSFTPILTQAEPSLVSRGWRRR